MFDLSLFHFFPSLVKLEACSAEPLCLMGLLEFPQETHIRPRGHSTEAAAAIVLQLSRAQFNQMYKEKSVLESPSTPSPPETPSSLIQTLRWR